MPRPGERISRLKIAQKWDFKSLKHKKSLCFANLRDFNQYAAATTSKERNCQRLWKAFHLFEEKHLLSHFPFCLEIHKQILLFMFWVAFLYKYKDTFSQVFMKIFHLASWLLSCAWSLPDCVLRWAPTACRRGTPTVLVWKVDRRGFYDSNQDCCIRVRLCFMKFKPTFVKRLLHDNQRSFKVLLLDLISPQNNINTWI